MILESSLEMARKLSMVSVAEGVETRASFELLQALNCDMAQGYFIARLMDGRSYLAWVRDRADCVSSSLNASVCFEVA